MKQAAVERKRRMKHTISGQVDKSGNHENWMQIEF